MLQLFGFFILSILIFYFLNNILKNNIKEHYLTYFMPFYHVENNDLFKFYDNNENNLNYFKKKFNFHTLKIGTNKLDEYFIEILIKNFISMSYVLNTNIIYYSNNILSIDDLNNNKINFSTTDYLTLNYYMNNLNKDINKLKLITTLFRQYIYIFTNKKYKIFTINNIPPDFIIGINKNDILINYYNIFLKNIGLIENINYKIILYNDINTLFKELNNEKCNMIMICDVFPNNNIITILNNLLNSDIILLPFELPNEKLFLKKQPSINIDYVDLNYLSNSYLPKKFGKYEFTKFRPMIKIPYIYKILITNIYTDPKVTYSFIKFYYENYKKINNNINQKGYKIDNIEINNFRIFFLKYHQGVLNFFKEKGYITNNNNENCKYLVGSNKCNNETLEANNLL